MNLPTQTVLHHHAHAAACLAEHQWPLDGGDVIALTLDGIGMGENGALWGGECLRVNYRECEHLGGLPAVALPGGDLAAKQPWRNLLAQCLRFVPECRITLKRQVCNSKTGAYWRGPLSVELTRRWRHRVGVCSMLWRRHWAVRQPR